MPTTVRLNLRRDCRDDNGELVPAFAEDVDLDALTPKARALAEAIHDCSGHQPLGIRIATGRLVRDSPNFAYLYGDGPEADAKGAEPETSVVRNWSVMRADSPMNTAEWLEREARTLPLDAYPVAAADGEPVPSAQAAADDRYLTRDSVLSYMRDAGSGMSVQAWDTFRGTGHTPEPDRYVQGRPQWRPETIDAYINRPRERWSIAQVADHLGVKAPSARGQLSRWGISAAAYVVGDGGRPEARFDADQVQAAYAHRPGRGKRTDLKPPF